MKKFLSSLLALTMILSLVIVPARAADDDGYSVKFNNAATVTIDMSAETTTATATAPNDVTPTNYVWSSSNTSVATVEKGDNGSATVTAKAKGTATITCTFTVPKEGAQQEAGSGNTPQTETKTASATIKVTDVQGDANAAFAAAIKAAGIKYNNRPCTINSANTTITYYTIPSEDATNPWKTEPTV